MKKVAVVTGAARGIGKSIAIALGNAGYNLALLATRSEKDVSSELGEIKATGADVYYYAGDLGVSGDRVGFIAGAIERFGAVDLLVNNAGVGPKVRMDILDTTEDSYDHVNNINLKGTFFLTQLVAKSMIENLGKRDGYFPRIINVSSVSAVVNSVQRAEYCISKAGVSMVTSLFAARLAEYNIGVFEIRPGVIFTDMTSTVQDKYTKMVEDGAFPIKRWGYPEDVAKAVLLLSSDLISYSTGEIFNVDGGFHLRRL